ncbi:hypothetical protein BHM03_00062982, partial [Ensete ventricosum]
RRICDCELGFPTGLRGGAAKGAFLDEIDALEEFLSDPWTVRPDAAEREEEETVQVWVPRVSPAVAVPSAVVDDGGGGGVGDEVKRAFLQRQALAASLAAEDYVRRLEAGGAAVSAPLASDDEAFFRSLALLVVGLLVLVDLWDNILECFIRILAILEFMSISSLKCFWSRAIIYFIGVRGLAPRAASVRYLLLLV